jgi:hypothetical protein
VEHPPDAEGAGLGCSAAGGGEGGDIAPVGKGENNTPAVTIHVDGEYRVLLNNLQE